MPRPHSDVWKHFTQVDVDGKHLWTCNYCGKSYVKNATKLQRHIVMCQKFLQTSNPGVDTICAPVDEEWTFSQSNVSTPGPSRMGTLFDFIDEDSRRNADECFARAVYATGLPLTVASNGYWNKFINVLRPAYNPPTTDALSTHLLDEEFERVQTKVKEMITKADCISVISNGWSNVQEQGIHNYIVITPQPVFYKRTDSRIDRHTGEYIAEEMKTVVKELGPEKVFALVTDSGARMEEAWAHVKESYPHVSTICCAAHALNLFFKDIMTLKSMNTLHKQTKQVLKDARGKRDVSAVLISKQKEKRRLRRYSVSAAGVVAMYESLLEVKESLQEIATSQSAEMDSEVQRILLDHVFWEQLSSSLSILKPIAAAIDNIEANDVILSDVVSVFAALKEKILTVLPTSLLLQAEDSAVVESLEKHRQLCLRPLHSAAFMLDPRYAAHTLSGEEINRAYSVITAVSEHLGLDSGKVLGSLALYRTKQGLWSGDGIWRSCQYITASTWWKGLCASEPIAPVASAVLQIPATTAAAEHWSHNTHTTVHNGLTGERVEKLVYIRANLRLFKADTETPSMRLDSDPEEEESDGDNSAGP